MLPLLTVSMSFGYSFLQEPGNIAQENTTTGEHHQPNSICFGRGSAMASFAFGDKSPGARTPHANQLNIVQVFVVL